MARWSPEYRYFLKQLVQAREEAGLSQRQAAAKLHRLQSYVSKCETGERRVDVVELVEFAYLYHKDLAFFVRPPASRP